MVGQTWQQGTVPNRYAQQTLEKAQQEIDQETAEIADPALQQQLHPLQQTLLQIALDIKQNYKTTTAASLQKLASQQQQLAAFEPAQVKQIQDKPINRPQTRQGEQP